MSETCAELGEVAWHMPRGRRGRREPSLAEFVCLSRGEQEGCGVSCCQVRPCSWGHLSVLTPAFPQVVAAEDCCYGAALAMGTALGCINFSARKHVHIYLSATTVKTKWSVISEVERVIYAGKSGVSGKPGLVFCDHGCGSRRTCVCQAWMRSPASLGLSVT